MLKFLDNRSHQRLSKIPKKFEPGFLYGNSFECPKQFQSKFTVFHQPSYVNPYLDYQKQRIVKISSENLPNVEPQWKRKVDLQSIQEQKIVSSHPDLIDRNKSQYLTSFYNQFDKNNGRFRKSRGEFTNFIEKNLKFKSLGPIHGDERDQTRINETKRSVWLKSSQSMFQNQSKNFKKSSQLNMSLRSSISKNSELLTQKNRIRFNRQKNYRNFRNSLQKRKYDPNNSHLFELPKKGPEHELAMCNISKKTMYGTRYLVTDNKEFEEDQLIRDLQRFQKTAQSKLK